MIVEINYKYDLIIWRNSQKAIEKGKGFPGGLVPVSLSQL